MKKNTWLLQIMLVALLTMAQAGVAFAGELDGKTVFVNNVQIQPTTANLADYHQADLKTIGAVNKQVNEYTNYPLGYRLQYPNDMMLDITDGNVRTVFINEECQVEIYYQPLNSTSYRNYVYYSNRFLQDTATYWEQKSYSKLVNGYEAKIVQWHRPTLTALQNDFPYYIHVDIQKSASEAYSIFIKSKRDISGDRKYMDMIWSFRLQAPFGHHEPVALLESEEAREQRVSRLNEETRAVLNDYFAPEQELSWGIFQPDAPYSTEKLYGIEHDLGQRFKFLVVYHHLFKEDEPMANIMQGLQNAYDNQYIVELTLQTRPLDSGNQIYEVLSGQHDEYLQQYAQALAEFGHPVLLRLGNEMNGDWCAYSGYHLAKDVDLYNKFYIYLYKIFQANGANENVLWVWNPNEKSFPDFTWNDMQLYYPGNQYVDIVGMTGYNTGTYYHGETWRTFDEIYAELYQKYTALFNKPLMITEFASSSIGGDKADWITDMFVQLPKYPAIKVAIWWSGCDWAVPNEVPARIYWLQENDEIFQAFKAGVSRAGA